ncbi:hypothetical protein G9P44_003712 [Scheffersomyces stipitis]|nr:hypothetical protein G9P44_003712 [Scheffersomyces stipitis]
MFDTDDEKWQALVNRDPRAEGEFVYCVLSTKIYSRPTCYSRLALRKNVSFCKNSDEARAMNFKPCKRCKPNVERGSNTTRELIIRACTAIFKTASASKPFVLDVLTAQLQISKFHLCRQFKNYTNMTPRKFYLKCKEIKQNPTNLLPVPIIETKKNLARKKMLNIAQDNETAAVLNSTDPLDLSLVSSPMSDNLSSSVTDSTPLQNPTSLLPFESDSENIINQSFLQSNMEDEDFYSDDLDFSWLDDFIKNQING